MPISAGLGMYILTNQSRLGIQQGLKETGAKTEHFRWTAVLQYDSMRKLVHCEHVNLF